MQRRRRRGERKPRDGRERRSVDELKVSRTRRADEPAATARRDKSDGSCRRHLPRRAGDGGAASGDRQGDDRAVRRADRDRTLAAAGQRGHTHASHWARLGAQPAPELQRVAVDGRLPVRGHDRRFAREGEKHSSGQLRVTEEDDRCLDGTRAREGELPHVERARLGDGRDLVGAQAEAQIGDVGCEATQQRCLARRPVDGAHEAIANGVAREGAVHGDERALWVHGRRIALVVGDRRGREGFLSLARPRDGRPNRVLREDALHCDGHASDARDGALRETTARPDDL